MRAFLFTGFLIAMLLSAKNPEAAVPEATIIDTGSTNRPGMTVTVDHEGHASVRRRNAEVRHLTLPEELCSQFLRDLKAALPLSALPVRHCIKSVSFGSSMFIEFNGDRSPDLSCPFQRDPAAAALQQDAKQILEAARNR